MQRFVDLAVKADAEGIYDITIDPTTRDFTLTNGLESAEFVSLFTDRRARADEVADPMKRRGTIIDLVADLPGDIQGSGLWLYEQRRLTREVAAGLRLEAEAALRWQVPDLAKSVSAEIRTDGASRTATLIITTTFADGGRTSRPWQLADATRKGLLARL